MTESSEVLFEIQTIRKQLDAAPPPSKPRAKSAQRSCMGPLSVRERLDVLFPQIQPELVKRARRWVPDEADDLVNDVYVKARKRSDSLPSDVNLRGYLYVALYHGALDIIRKRKKTVTTSDVQIPIPEPEPELPIDGKKLKAAIDRLPPNGREVMNLRLKGLRNQGIADHLGISYNAASLRVFRALEQLREIVFKDLR